MTAMGTDIGLDGHRPAHRSPRPLAPRATTLPTTGVEVAASAAGVGPVRVAPYAGERAEWDAFVHTSAAGTVFHDSRWLDVLEQSFGYRRRDLIARRDGCVVGVLPLCQLSLPVAGTCLLSLPFAVEAGVCACDAEAARALENETVAVARRHSARYVELRDGLGGADFELREGTYFRFRRALHTSDNENWRAIPRKRRRMIRVGQRSGLQVRTGSTELAAFHDLYARTALRLGSPVFGRPYFRRLLDAFRDDAILMTVGHAGVPMAGALSFVFRGSVIPYYAGSRR